MTFRGKDYRKYRETKRRQCVLRWLYAVFFWTAAFHRSRGMILDAAYKMVPFVSGLSKSERAMEFINSNGSDAYFQYGEALLFRKKEEELRKVCLEEAGLDDMF